MFNFTLHVCTIFSTWWALMFQPVLVLPHLTKKKKSQVAPVNIICWQLLGLSNYSSLTIPFRQVVVTVPWMKIASKEVSLQYFNEWSSQQDWPHVSVLRLLETVTSWVQSGRQGRQLVYVCHGSSPTRRSAECGLAGREDRLCTCVVAPPWHGDLRVWSGQQGRPSVYVCCAPS